MSPFEIRAAMAHDADAIADIYNHYVANSHATFETDPVRPEEMRLRIASAAERSYPFLVAEADTVIDGYAHAHEYRQRAAYRNTVEISIYVRPGKAGLGLGRRLYTDLFAQIRALGFHAAVAGIALPNNPSIHLHESFDMEKVAHFREVGQKFDRWIDVGYWELIL